MVFVIDGVFMDCLFKFVQVHMAEPDSSQAWSDSRTIGVPLPPERLESRPFMRPLAIGKRPSAPANCAATTKVIAFIRRRRPTNLPAGPLVTSSTEPDLQGWRERAAEFESEIKRAVIGRDEAIRLLTIAVFARGHVLLKGDVGLGNTTLLRALAPVLDGDYERIEGTIDFKPNDLVYRTYINEDGRPVVDPRPLLKRGEKLATFFFNEVNRARPQVHSLLLRVMAERSVSAFNREYVFPHLRVFADRNRVEKEETFELPAAARDRFLMELNISMPVNREMQRELMFAPRFFAAVALLALLLVVIGRSTGSAAHSSSVRRAEPDLG